MGCQHPADLDDLEDDDGNVFLTFSASDTRSGLGDYFSKLNVMLFNEGGERAFSKVKTQVMSDDTFGRMAMTLSPGIYTVVAVGHSSAKSATIKSPTDVRFTASDGEKLTDTFCHCGQVTVNESGGSFSLVMNRVAAMLQIKCTDEEIPESFAKIKIDYTGGSAKFNPSTSEGTTKSTQSETRQRSDAGLYQCYTFPYMAANCKLKVTISSLTDDGTIIRQRTLENVPMTRNRITTYEGPIFEAGDGNITQTAFGFTVNADWDGEDVYEF